MKRLTIIKGSAKMRTTDLFALLEKEIAPVSLSNEFCNTCGFYDNSGILIDGGNEISGVLFSLELSPVVVSEAKRLGFNAIVTHHPAIYGGISNLIEYKSPMASALTQCIRDGISVVSMHLNFDAAPQGIDYYLMRGVGGTNAKCLVNLSGGGYGRVYDIDSTSLSNLIFNLRKEFNTKRIVVYGDLNKQIKVAASFCGAGCDEKTMAFAVENFADVFISSDMKHHQIAELVSRGIAVVILTHYASECYGFNKIYDKISCGLGLPSSFYVDESLL